MNKLNLFFLFFLMSCTVAVKRHKVGVLATNEMPEGYLKRSLKVKKEKKCATLALFFIPVTTWDHKRLDKTVDGMIDRSKKEVALSNIEIETYHNFLFPFYFTACMKVKGYPLIHEKK